LKTENQIWADIIAAVNAGLVAQSVSGFSVQQGAQPSKSTISGPTIWAERVSSKRWGAQSRLPETIDGVLKEHGVYYQEIMIQITARKSRDPQTDTVTTQTSGDAANLLATYFNGTQGINKLSELGFNCIKVTDVRELAPMSDSDLYEKTPSFDLTLTHVQADIRTIQKVDGLEAGIYRAEYVDNSWKIDDGWYFTDGWGIDDGWAFDNGGSFGYLTWTASSSASIIRINSLDIDVSEHPVIEVTLKGATRLNVYFGIDNTPVDTTHFEGFAEKDYPSSDYFQIVKIDMSSTTWGDAPITGLALRMTDAGCSSVKITDGAGSVLKSWDFDSDFDGWSGSNISNLALNSAFVGSLNTGSGEAEILTLHPIESAMSLIHPVGIPGNNYLVQFKIKSDSAQTDNVLSVFGGTDEGQLISTTEEWITHELTFAPSDHGLIKECGFYLNENNSSGVTVFTKDFRWKLVS